MLFKVNILPHAYRGNCDLLSYYKNQQEKGQKAYISLVVNKITSHRIVCLQISIAVYEMSDGVSLETVNVLIRLRQPISSYAQPIITHRRISFAYALPS